MTLIIAEKPSLARSLASALGVTSRRRGFFEGGGYLITWAFGHLFSLCDIEDYTGKTHSGRWSMENLPCFPAPFRFELRRGQDGAPDAGVKEQFEIIRTLCHRADVDRIVNAGDADREGEIIIRLILMHCEIPSKPVFRLWLPDQTPETIRGAIQEMKEDSAFDLLAAEGFARTYLDWLYGVNLTRYATLKAGTLLRVGRVIVPIVKAIYDRDMAIEHFVSEPYFAVSAKLGESEVTSRQKFSAAEKEKALRYAERLNQAPSIVTARTAKKETLNPPKLFSLSKLQNYLGKKYKMPMDQSLSVLQELYEKGYVTYPRTNSEYLACAEKEKIARIIELLQKIGYPLEQKDKKTVYDDQKIESHSALTPTTHIPSPDALTPAQKQVYQAILRRFAAVFCREETIAQKATLTISAGGVEEFTLKASVIVQKGWTRFEEPKGADKILPDYKKGDEVPLTFAPVEKKTTPPKHYTIETLNNYLKNPFREEKARATEEEGDDAEEYRAMFEGLELGTEATRTGIIDNACRSGYIQLKKDVYTLLDGGKHLIETLLLLGISMDKYKTVQTGKALKSVFHGEMDIDGAVAIAREEIRTVFAQDATHPDRNTGFFGDLVGTCPVCRNEVRKGRYSYHCTARKDGCRFSIPLVLCQRPIPLSAAKSLLETGHSASLTGFVSARTGKTFDASLKIENQKVVFDFSKNTTETL